MFRRLGFPWRKKEKRCSDKPTIELIRSRPLDPDASEIFGDAASSAAAGGDDGSVGARASLSTGRKIKNDPDPDYASLGSFNSGDSCSSDSGDKMSEFVAIETSRPPPEKEDAKEPREPIYSEIKKVKCGENTGLHGLLKRQPSADSGSGLSLGSFGICDASSNRSSRSSLNSEGQTPTAKRQPFSTFGVDFWADLPLSAYFSAEESWQALSSARKSRGSTPSLSLPSRHSNDLEEEGLVSPPETNLRRSTSVKKSVTFNEHVQFNRNSIISSELSASDPDVTNVKRKLLAHEAGMSVRCGHDIRGDLTRQLPLDPHKEDAVSLASDDDDVYSDVMEGEEPEELVQGMIWTVRRTAALLLAWFCLGLYTQLSGPTLPHLMHAMNATYEETARTFAANGGGLLIGSAMAGAIFSLSSVSCDVILGTMLGVAGVVTVAPPWCKSVLELGIASAVEGVTRGVIYVGSIVQGTRIWHEDWVSFWIQILHVTYCAGSMLSSQCARPFLDSSNATSIVAYLHALGIEDIVRVVGNGDDTSAWPRPSTDYKPEFNISRIDDVVLTTAATIEAPRLGVDLSLMSILYGLVALVVFLSAGIFLSLYFYDVYVRCQQRRKRKRFGRKKQRTEKIRMAKEAARKERLQRLLGQTLVEIEEETVGSDSGSMIIHEDEGKANGAEVESEQTEVQKPSGSTPVARSSIETLSDGATETTTNHMGNGTAGHQEDGVVKKNGHVKIQLPTERKKESRIPWFRGDRHFDLPTLLFLYVFFTIPMGIEVCFSKYLFSLALSTESAMSTFEAALLLTVFWGCVLLGRVVFLCLSRRDFAPNVLMIVCLTLNVVSLAMLAKYGHRFRSLLLMFAASFGIFMGPVFPAGLTWTNMFLNLRAKSIAMAYAMGAVGMMLLPWLAGLLLEYFNMVAMVYLLIAYSSLSLLLYVPVMKSLGQRKTCKVKIRRGKEFVISNSTKTYV